MRAAPKNKSKYSFRLVENNFNARNGLGIKHAKVMRFGDGDSFAVLPDILSPMVLSSVKGNISKFAINDGGKQNGPFLNEIGAFWLYEFVTSFTQMLDNPLPALKLKLIALNSDDKKYHGRIGDALYVLLDISAAMHGKVSPSLMDFKVFMNLLKKQCCGRRIDVPLDLCYAQDVLKSLNEISVLKEGAVYNYANFQFPEMIQKKGSVSYYKLSSISYQSPATYYDDFIAQAEENGVVDPYAIEDVRGDQSLDHSFVAGESFNENLNRSIESNAGPDLYSQEEEGNNGFAYVGRQSLNNSFSSHYSLFR